MRIIRWSVASAVVVASFFATWGRCRMVSPGLRLEVVYDWAWITVNHPAPGHRCLLIRRNRATGELAFYRYYSPRPVTPAILVKVAGLRWTIEETSRPARA